LATRAPTADPKRKTKSGGNQSQVVVGACADRSVRVWKWPRCDRLGVCTAVFDFSSLGKVAIFADQQPKPHGKKFRQECAGSGWQRVDREQARIAEIHKEISHPLRPLDSINEACQRARPGSGGQTAEAPHLAARTPHARGICGFHDSSSHGATIDRQSYPGGFCRR
jgi:hypothetical protein